MSALGGLRLEPHALGRARIVALAVVPVGLFVLATIMRAVRGSYHLGANSDPDYAYLTNALNVVGLQAPDLYEHPGITVELLGAIAILARWLPSRLAGDATGVHEAVLANPEAYLSAISTFFALVVGVAAFAAGLQAFRTWRSLLPALTVQLSPLLFVPVPAALPRVTPEPILIVAALLLVTALIPVVADAGVAGRRGRAVPLLVGTMMGFGLATKFTFLPLLGFILLLPGRLSKLLALAACGLGFVVFTLPVAVYYKYMLGWLQTLATHKGVNGSGETGVLDLATWLTNVNSLIPVAVPLFVLVAICLLLALGLSFRGVGFDASDRARIRTLFVASGLVFAAQIVLTAKQPSGHYLMPSLAASGLTTAGIVILVMRARNVASLLPVRLGFAVVLLAGLVNAGLKDYDYAKTARAYADGIDAFERRITPKDASLVAYYGSSQIEYALAFGNDFARNRYDARLRELYPDALFYSIWERRFYSFAGNVRSEEIGRLLRSGRAVLMYGFPLVDGYAVYQTGLILEPVLVDSGKAVYRLVGLEVAQASAP